MKAAVVHEWGQQPRYLDFPEPQQSDGAVVAAVEASALTNLSRMVIMGKHYSSKEIQLPAIAGVDGVARLDDGTRVYTGSLAPYGLMAERTLVVPSNAVPVPEHVDSVTAAAVPNPGTSAWMTLDYAAQTKPGDHVLVLGATGVTGSIAAQLAKSVFGAGRVVVAGRNPERLDWLRTVGADDVIRLGTDDLTESVVAQHSARPFDAVIDYLWGDPAQQTLAALAAAHPSTHFHATRFVQVGSMTGESITIDAATLRSTGITLQGLGIGSVPPDAMLRARTEGLPRLFAMLEAGELQLTTVAKPLADIENVWAAKEPSGTRVVITP
ncbi:zinc-binding alcohol dehydrogenase family protein [Mycobacterium sp. CBMA293]|uniref:quinone oxidoreductase family protein n=1 Tax=unclassified Mycolicibacterium TaxID=2636767 RepID=UPI0012DEFF51|nr:MULTISPECIES: zinc-binding alcohol dehydrogenase family protein [unclassified Mycolicibacterium]MUL47652.1 zinc-binding alcohol dehydrogenase family protein [Mycolicibacterium sp. CBMA 360]MUL61830.1 zinc-binding alcohol dehydrogenase family protein [Mycolicibacterium sp. CBMA 335]MUL70894.1 zinc-binding alcohol dehydrogenase family protein [Mycolicibacterium sp. CBMA 311]MUL92880.1 zinc-binding alcohol dehydrogenase family protein [Mycolicibacterium sp. CBMA 230]MUM08678.1 alcohol dehydrog